MAIAPTTLTPLRPTSRDFVSHRIESRNDEEGRSHWFAVFDYADGSQREFGSIHRDTPSRWHVTRLCDEDRAAAA